MTKPSLAKSDASNRKIRTSTNSVGRIPIETSARHIHLSDRDLSKLFSQKLKPMKNLSQTGEFASDKVVEIINGKNKLSARVLGPTRKESQIEISLTDAYKLGMKALPPIKVSGDLGNAPKLTVKNKNKKIQVKAIIAKRHLHCDPNTAKKLKLKNNQKIKIQTQGPRALIFDEIIVRVHPTYTLALHLDTDEANAAGLSNSGKRAWGKIIK